jgi:hypothetical protein
MLVIACTCKDIFKKRIFCATAVSYDRNVAIKWRDLNFEVLLLRAARVSGREQQTGETDDMPRRRPQLLLDAGGGGRKKRRRRRPPTRHHRSRRGEQDRATGDNNIKHFSFVMR